MNNSGKTQVPGFYKMKDGIVLNTDNQGVLAYKKKKAQGKKIETIEKDVNDMKSDLQEIKNLLRGLIK